MMDFISAQQAGAIVMSQDNFIFNKYRNELQKKIKKEAQDGQIELEFQLPSDVSTNVRNRLEETLRDAGFEYSSWSWHEDYDNNYWYEITISWGHEVFTEEA